MRAACGTGGTVKDGRIEIQGDKRDAVARILAEAGLASTEKSGWPGTKLKPAGWTRVRRMVGGGG